MNQDTSTESRLHQIAPFQVGDWLVQPALTSLERGDTRRHLEPKVMQVLVYLAGHPGEVLSKEQIIDAVWGAVFVAEGVLVRSISELRRALEDDAKNPRYIVTIPKTGYRLIASVSHDVEVPTAPGPDAAPDPETSPEILPRAQRHRPAISVLAVLVAASLIFVLYTTWTQWREPSTDTAIPSTGTPRSGASGAASQISASASGSSAADLHQRGREFFQRYRQTDNENAIELFKRALEIDPGHAPAYAGLAEAYAFKVMRYAEPPRWSIPALDAGRGSVDLEPESALAQQALGVALLVRGFRAEALTALHRAVELDSGLSSAAHYLGMAYAASGRLETSVSWHQKALGLEAANAWQLALMGHTFRLLGDLQRAESWFRRSLEFEPFQMEARLGLAELALIQGDVITARHSLKEYLEVEPGHAPTLTLLARAEMAGNDLRAAESLCRGALGEISETSPDSPDPRTRLLLAWILLKDESDTPTDDLTDGQRGEESRRLLDALASELQNRLDAGSEEWQPHYLLAGVHALRSDDKASLDASLNALHAAVEAGFRDHLGLAADPVFAELDAEPKFRRLLMDLETRVGEMRRRVDNP